MGQVSDSFPSIVAFYVQMGEEPETTGIKIVPGSPHSKRYWLIRFSGCLEQTYIVKLPWVCLILVYRIPTVRNGGINFPGGVVFSLPLDKGWFFHAKNLYKGSYADPRLATECIPLLGGGVSEVFSKRVPIGIFSCGLPWVGIAGIYAYSFIKSRALSLNRLPLHKTFILIESRNGDGETSMPQYLRGIAETRR